MDPKAGSGQRQHRHHLRHRHQLAGRPEGRRRRQPVLPGARQRRDEGRRLSGRVRRDRADASPRSRRAGRSRREHRSPSASGHRARHRCAISGSATAPTSPERPRRTTRSPRRRPPTAARGSARWCRMIRQHDQREAVLTVTSNRRPTATITRRRRGRSTAAARSSTTRAPGPIRRTARCRRARSPGRWTSITTRTRTRSCRRRAGRPAAVSPSRQPAIPSRTCGIASISPCVTQPAPPRRVQRDILPRKASITLATSPAGLPLRLDGQPVATPVTFEAVVGIVREPRSHHPAGVGRTTTYEFVSWSDGGAAIAHHQHARLEHDLYSDVSNRGQRRHGDGAVARSTSTTWTSRARTVSRTDPTVDFAWGSGSPAAAIGPDTFSARWTGQVEAPFSGTYTFYTVSDDGVRLSVNGVQVINQWNDHAPTEHSGTIALTAGQRYAIQMEYYENGGGATARLLWSHASITKAVVPATPALSIGRPVQYDPGQLPARIRADPGRLSPRRRPGLRCARERPDLRLEYRQHRSGQRPQLVPIARPGLRHAHPHAGRRRIPTAVWEIGLPNGTYTVRLVAGDARTSTASTGSPPKAC